MIRSDIRVMSSAYGKPRDSRYTTAVVAKLNQRNKIQSEIIKDLLEMTDKLFKGEGLPFLEKDMNEVEVKLKQLESI